MHLYRVGELTLYSLTDISLNRVPININESRMYTYFQLHSISICIINYCVFRKLGRKQTILSFWRPYRNWRYL